jgi:hypothetical protein
MKNIFKIFLTVFISFGIIGGCGGGDGSWGPISFTSSPKKPKCANDERRCHGICYPKSLDCPKDEPTDTDIYIQSHSCYKITDNTLELIVRGVAYGPVGTEITFDFDNPIRAYEEISCSIRWEEGHNEGLNLDYCIRTELSNNPVTSWLVRTIGHSDKFAEYEDITVYVDGKSARTTVNCPDATGDIPREDCFTFYEISLSECPAEKVLNVCERYECIGQCGGYIECSEYGYYFVPYFPDDFTGCRVIDCDTIDCDQANNIHVDGLLSWTEYIDGQESEAGCF